MKEFDQSDQDRLPFADGDGQIFDLVNGLPTDDDLTPLSMLLVPPDLASAFGIPLPDLKSTVDVHLATQKTISSLSFGRDFSSSPPVNLSIKTIPPESIPIIPDLEESPPSEISERFLEVVSAEEISVYPSDLHEESPLIDQRALKRPRLVWKPHLHKRFVEAVTHLGAKNAVPKTIMQLMNVDGLSRENVASHLQKYRLYLKRLQEFSDEGSSSSDNCEQLYQQDQRQTMLNPAEIPSMAYAVSPMIPMPVYTIPHSNYQSYGMVMLNGHQGGTPYHGFDDRRFE